MVAHPLERRDPCRDAGLIAAAIIPTFQGLELIYISIGVGVEVADDIELWEEDLSYLHLGFQTPQVISDLVGIAFGSQLDVDTLHLYMADGMLAVRRRLVIESRRSDEGIPMAAQLPSEIESFHRFLTERLEQGEVNLSPEASVEAFRAYQRELERCREEIQPALERSLRGESAPLDIEEVKARVTKGLADQGITD